MNAIRLNTYPGLPAVHAVWHNGVPVGSLHEMFARNPEHHLFEAYLHSSGGDIPIGVYRGAGARERAIAAIETSLRLAA